MTRPHAAPPAPPATPGPASAAGAGCQGGEGGYPPALRCRGRRCAARAGSDPGQHRGSGAVSAANPSRRRVAGAPVRLGAPTRKPAPHRRPWTRIRASALSSAELSRAACSERMIQVGSAADAERGTVGGPAAECPGLLHGDRHKSPRPSQAAYHYDKIRGKLEQCSPFL